MAEDFAGGIEPQSHMVKRTKNDALLLVVFVLAIFMVYAFQPHYIVLSILQSLGLSALSYFFHGSTRIIYGIFATLGLWLAIKYRKNLDRHDIIISCALALLACLGFMAFEYYRNGFSMPSFDLALFTAVYYGIFMILMSIGGMGLLKSEKAFESGPRTCDQKSIAMGVLTGIGLGLLVAILYCIINPDALRFLFFFLRLPGTLVDDLFSLAMALSFSAIQTIMFRILFLGFALSALKKVFPPAIAAGIAILIAAVLPLTIMAEPSRILLSPLSTLIFTTMIGLIPAYIAYKKSIVTSTGYLWAFDAIIPFAN